MADAKLAGRVALITGASRNIGRATALAFAAEGADLVLNTRANADELEAVAAECRKAGVRVVTALADVADPKAVESMVKRGLAELGAIDVLVCNAAIRPHKALTDTSIEEWHRVLDVNLNAGFYLARRGARDEDAAARQHHRPRWPVQPHEPAQYRRGHGGQDRAPRPGERAQLQLSAVMR